MMHVPKPGEEQDDLRHALQRVAARRTFEQLADDIVLEQAGDTSPLLATPTHRGPTEIC